MSINSNIDFKSAGRLLGRYLQLNVENMRLSLTERLTILLSTATFFLIALLLASIALVAATMSVAHFLESVMDLKWVYLIIAGFYLLIIALLWIFRRKFLVDPVCRFLSRLIVEPPKKGSGN